ncbi:uncharacterized protein LOC120677904 [Panicum virgatum]|uniref:uncharacterized protein LOC120677904 n=1 Tax=Panicum virgatum TaxID=38727 RepID=UPI0019D5A753|nr:uncharacterized protein LOC120677904 [Panicum virgatum]
MGRPTSAVRWWEESQMRVLVLSSLVAQCLLYVFTYLRIRAINPGWIRFQTWLAYLGGDAIAIYALATLFNRHKQEDQGGGGGTLEVVWAPILLLHLGGNDGITAYNIEDNELWTRHLLTAVSQVTVAVYVFLKSWPWAGGDKRLLLAAVVLFVPGVLKCFAKPWDLKKASIKSLVSLPAAQRTRKQKQGMKHLEEYVQPAATTSKLKQVLSVREQKGTGVDDEQAQGGARASVEGGDNNPVPPPPQGSGAGDIPPIQGCRRRSRQRKRDALPQGKQNEVEMDTLEQYLKGAMAFVREQKDGEQKDEDEVSSTTRAPAVEDMDSDHHLSITTSHERVEKDTLPATKITATRCGLRVSLGARTSSTNTGPWSRASRPAPSWSWSLSLKAGWKKKIHDPVSYHKFNDNRGQWALEGNEDELGWSIKGSFDESVVLWHIATDFCFFSRSPPTRRSSSGEQPASHKAVQCRQMSNYMMYLLFVNPEMLLPGTRRNLFTTAYNDLKYILRDNKLMNPQSSSQQVEEKALMETLINTMRDRSKKEDPNIGSEENFIDDAWDLAQGLFKLRDDFGDEKMWKAIQGVWVEMLCFSASRCRGYLHAKALGSGGEFLSYVWLLLFYMGMETFTERLQREREELPSREANGNDAPPPSDSHNGNATTSSSTSWIPSRGASSSTSHLHNGASTSSSEIEIVDMV